MLFLDERSFPGKLLAGTLDPDCHAGFGTETTRPLLAGHPGLAARPRGRARRRPASRGGGLIPMDKEGCHGP